jgi:superkiller protein 3
MQASEKWQEASTIFSRVDALLPNDLEDGLRSREEAAWCKSRYLGPAAGIDELNAVLRLLEEQETREHDQARCLWRCGQLLRESGEKEDSYRRLISCLKTDSAFAPAFTSLGFYYLELSPADTARASKCFQKAFELDPTETKAAQQLCQGFAEEQEWELVEVIAKRTIDGEGGNDPESREADPRITTLYLPTNVWAWKAMGIVELMNRDYAAAIQSLQVALRADSNDAVSWLRLGEAYSRAGKQAAALKALRKAQELNSKDWLCDYFIGDVERQLGQYEEAITSFRSILDSKPGEVGTLALLSQTYLELGHSELANSFMARAEYSFACCIRESLQLINHHSGFSSLAWKLVADSLFCLSERTSFYDEDMVSSLLNDVGSLIPCGSERVPSVTGNEDKIDGMVVLRFSILVYDHRLSLGFSDASVAGSAWYDMGVSLHAWSIRASSKRDVSTTEQEALRCIIEAVRIDPGSAANWTALGALKFVSEPKVAQHAYIMAVEIDNKNVEAWTNLGLLYLYHEDIELASQMFSRAQILDPDHTLTWIGQALVSSFSQSGQEADLLFEHAATLTASIPSADLNFASRSFRKLLRNPAPSNFYPVFLVLNRYTACRPDDATALNLYALVAERLGHLEFATELMEKAISLLESAYEESEDAKIERQFTIANCNLARMLLSCGRPNEALDAFAAVLGLLEELEDVDIVGYAAKSQAQLGSSLVHLHLGDVTEAVRCLEEASMLAERTGRDDLRSWVTVLLAKILWSTDTEEAREQAKNLLLEKIADDPEDIGAIQTLAGMGILSADNALVDAAVAEIISLPINQRHVLDPERELDYLLRQYSLAQGDIPRALFVLQSAAHAEPHQTSNRSELARLLVQLNRRDEASAVLGRSENGAEALKAICGSEPAEALQLAQKGVMLRPGDINTWRGLAVIRAASRL